MYDLLAQMTESNVAVLLSVFATALAWWYMRKMPGQGAVAVGESSRVNKQVRDMGCVRGEERCRCTRLELMGIHTADCVARWLNCIGSATLVDCSHR